AISAAPVLSTVPHLWLADYPSRKAPQTGRLRWFALGWPAFIGVIIIFWLMVAKPELAL
ncbi:putative membrane protein, partial [Novosphingobium chloroacetimidivorans]|nr:putative membrane protein [Novosphingobium chloroacetimidivorans]